MLGYFFVKFATSIADWMIVFAINTFWRDFCYFLTLAIVLATHTFHKTGRRMTKFFCM